MVTTIFIYREASMSKTTDPLTPPARAKGHAAAARKQAHDRAQLAAAQRLWKAAAKALAPPGAKP